MQIRPLTFILLLLSAAVANAQVKMAAIFSDHMVLQRSMPVPIWGTAAPTKPVTVTLTGASGHQEKTGVTDEQGHWSVTLDPLIAGGPYEMTVQSGDTVTVHDILVGEVWVGSGQSNMELPIELTQNGTMEIASANDPQLRLIKVNRLIIEKPDKDLKGNWVVCTPENLGPKPATATTRATPGLSGLCYYFGRNLRQKLNVPVGVIDSSFGGSPAEMWITAEGMRNDPALKKVADRWDQLIAAHPADQARFDAENVVWQKAVETAKATSQPAPPHPKWIEEYRYGGMYNGMIAPLIPFSIRGMIWYQGESNARDFDTYRELFPQLIRSWRSAWRRDDLPFIFVQLAGYGSSRSEPTDSNWARLRDAQTAALALPFTAMATAADIGEPNIHPKNKQELARRLALCAEAVAYGQDVQYQGPTLAGMKVEGAKIRIHFDHADGLSAESMPARLGNVPAVPAGEASQFSIAGPDRNFVFANAAIDGHDVVVWSDAVLSPVAVRYAWAENPICNLCNSAGLLAAPFRTDGWPVSTGTTRPATQH